MSGQDAPKPEDVGLASRFGEKGRYWEQYKIVTDKWDTDMMDRLNNGLDNLLIFVSERIEAFVDQYRRPAT